MVLRYYVSYSNYVCKQFDYLKIAVKQETMFKFVIIQLYCKVMVILQKFNEYTVQSGKLMETLNIEHYNKTICTILITFLFLFLNIQ